MNDESDNTTAGTLRARERTSSLRSHWLRAAVETVAGIKNLDERALQRGITGEEREIFRKAVQEQLDRYFPRPTAKTGHTGKMVVLDLESLPNSAGVKNNETAVLFAVGKLVDGSPKPNVGAEDDGVPTVGCTAKEVFNFVRNARFANFDAGRVITKGAVAYILKSSYCFQKEQMIVRPDDPKAQNAYVLSDRGRKKYAELIK